MASVKDKEKTNDTAESIPKVMLSDKKTPKSLKPKPKIVKKSVNQNSAQKKETEINAAESIPKVMMPSDKKTPKSLKPEPKIVKKSVNQNSAKMKETKITSEVQDRNKHQGGKRESYDAKKDGGRNINLADGNRKKKITNEKLEEGTRSDPRAEEDLGGVIFMCNSKTKPDCFQYLVMGVPTNKQELVMSIKPGLKLFLYDFDLKLLYGIYEASSAGGMKLEPAAFGGNFPVQVRFKVHKDCLPLPEDIFKKAIIKEKYNEKTSKFKTVLTVQQVKKLTELFQPAPSWHSNAQSSVKEMQPAPTMDEEAHLEQFHRNRYTGSKAAGSYGNHYTRHPLSPRASPDPLFLTEKEYRSYGLRRERHMLTTAIAPISWTLDAYRTDGEIEQLQRDPASVSEDARKKEVAPLDPLFIGEKEYRAYGLRREVPTAVTPFKETASVALDNYPKDPYYPYNYGSNSLAADEEYRAYGLRRELPTAVTPPKETVPIALDNYPKDPYYPYSYGSSLLADRYLPTPRTVTVPSESYSLTTEEARVNDFTYMESDTRNYRARVVPNETERLYSSYASRSLSDYNQKYHHLGGEPEVTATSVSSRYSFAAPSQLYR